MSNLIYACWRSREAACDDSVLQRVADRISSLDLSLCSHQMASGPLQCLCLTGPPGVAKLKGTSAHVGVFAGATSDWDVPGAGIPEGSFALVRADDHRVELCSDCSGSRTLWYAFSEQCFFASTSLRAIVCLLGDFIANKSAISWFLSSGSLGPLDAWDKRVSRLPADGRLTLDRVNWKLEVHAEAVQFKPRPMQSRECREGITGVLRETLQDCDFRTNRWILPLSGGLDSRCILVMLHELGLELPTVTWGLASSIHQPGNDAYIARGLARHFGVPHEYLLTENQEEAPVVVVDRFLSACGGTTDQLPGYLDGLRLWSSLATRGVEGIIRGDAGFNGDPVHSMQQARTSSGLVLLSDFLDAEMVDHFSDGRQSIPEALNPLAGESLACYRDRVYHAFCLPVCLAALNDVKAPFVEIANPLLSRAMLDFIREMPDSFRNGRRIYTQLVSQMEPTLPVATMEADDNHGEFLWSIPYLVWLEEELGSDLALRLFPAAFRDALMADIRRGCPVRKSSRSFRAAVKRVIRPSWIQAMRARLGDLAELPGRMQLALRAALVCRMHRILEQDASLLGEREGRSPA